MTTDEAGTRAALTRGQMASALRIAAGDGEPQASGADPRTGARVTRAGSTVTLAMVLTGTLVAARLSSNEADFERTAPSADGPAGSIPRNAATARGGGGVADSRQEQAAMLKKLTGVAAATAVGAAAMIGTSAGAQVVQWTTQAGGNGHWYARMAYGAYPSWSAARDAAVAMGGHLVTLSNASEESFVQALIGSGSCKAAQYTELEIGLYQAPGSAEPAGGWRWVTGEPLVYTHWRPGEPSNNGNVENFGRMNATGGWNDVEDLAACGNAALIEWSADCNHDGIVDYGQILAGQLTDANGNGVPDCCEGATDCCPGDIFVDHRVDGADLAAVLSHWGVVSSDPASIACDLDHSGRVDGTDLGILLAHWGPCGQ